MISRVRLEFKLEDMWIGVFWKKQHVTTDGGKVWLATDIWVCLVPCVPIHITILNRCTIPFDGGEA